MSYGLADLITQIVIEDGLKNLRDNPHHLEYILSRHCQIPALHKKVGQDYIRNAMELISNQKLTIRPYYVLNQDLYPNIVIAASYTEGQTYLGDYGSEEHSKIVVNPIVFAKFDAKKIKDDEIWIAKEYEIEKKIWIGIPVVNCDYNAKIIGIALKEDKTVLFLDKKLENGTPLKGWEAKTTARPRMVSVAASSDDVTVQAKLATAGDPDIHRIYSLVIRYCLKRGRILFEKYGFQNIHVTQSPPVVSEQEDAIMETVFTVGGLLHDSWIDHEYDVIDRIETDSVLVSENPKNERVKF